MANKYKVKKLGNFKLVTNDETFDVETEVDSLNNVVMRFGSSFTLKLDYDSVNQLNFKLDEVLATLQDQAIDQAVKPNEDSKYRGNVAMHDPIDW